MAHAASHAKQLGDRRVKDEKLNGSQGELLVQRTHGESVELTQSGQVIRAKVQLNLTPMFC